MRLVSPFATLLFSLLMAACSRDRPIFFSPEMDTEVQQRIQQQLADARPGDTIILPEGFFEFEAPIHIRGQCHITIIGQGMEKTIFSFRYQRNDEAGFIIAADSILLADFTIQDSRGSGIQLEHCAQVSIRRVRTSWSDGPDEGNGPGGISAMRCTGLHIDSCEVFFATEAGIRISQSDSIAIRNSLASGNVVGIALENCRYSAIYDNRCEGNTAGILLAELPGSDTGRVSHCVIYHNTIRDNNLANFCPSGNIHASLPPGTGIYLIAAKQAAIYDNDISEHKTVGTAITSYAFAEIPWTDTLYYPFAYQIDIRDNRYRRKKSLPDLSSSFGQMVNILFAGKPQDILYDGIIDTLRPAGPNPMQLCIHQEPAGLRFAVLDAGNNYDKVSKDMKPYQGCDGGVD